MASGKVGWGVGDGGVCFSLLPALLLPLARLAGRGFGGARRKRARRRAGVDELVGCVGIIAWNFMLWGGLLSWAGR